MILNRPTLVILLLLIIAAATDPRVAAMARSWQKTDQGAQEAYEAHLNQVEKQHPGTRAWLAAGY